MMVTCKVVLHKAAHDAIQLPGNVSASVKRRAVLENKMEAAVTAEEQEQMGLRQCLWPMQWQCFSLKRLVRNQLALDRAKFLKFISDGPITQE